MAEKFDYVSEIWDIAEYARDTFKRSEYNRIVLPFVLFRRLECALEATRDDVIESLKANEAEWGRDNYNYCEASGRSFYNLSNFRLSTLGASDTYNAFIDYVNAFSPNARDILNKFELENTAKRLDNAGMLYEICKKFSKFDLSPEAVSDREMSDIYEHLIERYGEEIAEGAEDFMTPRDIVRLAVGMVFANDDELMNSDTGIVRTLSDPTAGTCGFISDALDLLDEWHSKKAMKAPAKIVPYGQECEPESWAMGKTNLLLRNVASLSSDRFDRRNDLSEHIMFGDTLANDKFPDITFDYQLSNPPYGKNWKKQKSDVEDEAALGFKGRFGAGLPSIDDGAMLFLQHVAAKMKPVSEGGGKAGIVLSASPLFNGEPGTGPSTIRRWLFKNDLVDCIVKLGSGLFFRTTINTYLWILNNNKPADRRGMIQLIDASDMKTSMRKNRGKKNYEINEEQQKWIIETYVDGHDHCKSVMVPVEDFMYRRVITQRPLRMHIIIPFDLSNIGPLPFIAEADMEKVKSILSKYVGDNPYKLADIIAVEIKKAMADVFSKLSKKEKTYFTPKNIAKWIRDNFGVINPSYEAVDTKGNVIPEDELLAYAEVNGDDIVTDSNLKDYEDIAWNVSFDEYMKKEVLPFTPDAWIDKNSTDEKGSIPDHKIGTVGTKISFNKYFYKYEVPKDPEVIAKELLELENGLETFLKGFIK